MDDQGVQALVGYQKVGAIADDQNRPALRLRQGQQCPALRYFGRPDKALGGSSDPEGSVAVHGLFPEDLTVGKAGNKKGVKTIEPRHTGTSCIQITSWLPLVYRMDEEKSTGFLRPARILCTKIWDAPPLKL